MLGDIQPPGHYEPLHEKTEEKATRCNFETGVSTYAVHERARQHLEQASQECRGGYEGELLLRESKLFLERCAVRAKQVDQAARAARVQA
jgi:hypothetical protein